MTTRELEALESRQLYDAGTLRFGRRRVRGMDADAREEPTEAGDRGDGEVVVTEGNDAKRLADLQGRLELGERALERERAERTREQQEWKESADELENQLQASLREADNIRATMELEKLREVEALRRQFDREREQWRQDRDREWRRFDEERERLQCELRSELERSERRLEEIQMEKVRVEERVRELESIVAMHGCGDSEGREEHASRRSPVPDELGTGTDVSVDHREGSGEPHRASTHGSTPEPTREPPTDLDRPDAGPPSDSEPSRTSLSVAPPVSIVSSTASATTVSDSVTYNNPCY